MQTATTLLISLLFLIIKKKRKKHKHSPIFKRNYTNINLDQLLSDFENIDSGAKVLDNSISLNEAVSHMIHLLNDLCDKHAPLTKVPKRKITYLNLGLQKIFYPILLLKAKWQLIDIKTLNSLRKCGIR